MSSILRRALLAVLASCVVSSGCLTFQEQTITYVHDARANRLYLHETYSGIFSARTTPCDPPGDELCAPEQVDLIGVWQGAWTFFFDNMLGANLELMKLELASPPSGYGTDAERAHETALREMFRSVVANVRISNGPFYLDDRRRLSAVQRVTVDHVADVLKAVNRVMLTALLVDPESPDYPLGLRAAAADLTFVSLDGQRFTLRTPASRPRSEAARSKRWLEAGGGTVKVVDGFEVWTFGRPGSRCESITLPVAGWYQPNAVSFVRDQFGIALKFDRDDDADFFFSSRDPQFESAACRAGSASGARPPASGLPDNRRDER